MYHADGIADVVFGNNNGVRFVVVNPDGRLASLADGNKGWVFGDHGFDPLLKQVFHGDKEDWRKLKKTMGELGLGVHFHNTLGVPFSNGTKGRDDFSRQEYALRRDDNPPTEDVLRRILNPGEVEQVEERHRDHSETVATFIAIVVSILGGFILGFFLLWLLS